VTGTTTGASGNTKRGLTVNKFKGEEGRRVE